MVEICCGSYEDALNAYYGGAKRIELNTALHLGGLTPSISSLKLIKKNTKLKVICMIRPRGAGFCYSNIEFEQMLQEGYDLLENGADGLAFGFLNQDYTIDINKTQIMFNLIKKYNKEAVFHRAYDCVSEPYSSIEILIKIGINRILTSGLQQNAEDGIELIKELQYKYGNQIEILVGGGINKNNCKNIINYTNIKQIHSSCKTWKTDITTINKKVNFCYGLDNNKDKFDIVSKELVNELINLIPLI